MGVPGARVVVPAARPGASAVAAAVRGWPGEPVVLDPRGDPDFAGIEAGFAGEWLAAHPLTRTDLEQEMDLLQSIGLPFSISGT